METWTTRDWFDCKSGDPDGAPCVLFTCKVCGYQFEAKTYRSSTGGMKPSEQQTEERMQTHIAIFHRDQELPELTAGERDKENIKPQGAKCDCCGEIGMDRRNLMMACGYDMMEIRIPFRHIKIERIPGFNSGFFQLFVCKKCRANWLRAIELWYERGGE